ncbi:MULTISPECIES: IS1 family transposase [Trichocoleus]|uniref:IS1 family transposase n=1 Tax=Trichocoleus desertorum GB2-A4 TaxID=2933944 RepID=A0ABV0JG25_9CYAN|nr:IS1 family transposase [Trichocoleus sp. FACHB-46]MBD1865217.1 IS1 family transposase [Trichocoleus sp. FACHB-46]
MECRLCGHPTTHKHGKAPNGTQRYFCPHCQQKFNERFDTLYYHRQVTPEQIRQVLQAHSEGSSLKGVSRITGLAYNTVVSIVRAASQQAQLVHNAQVQAVQTQEVSTDELWCFVKKQKQCLLDELEVRDCWIGMSLTDSSGLILAARVGKYTDELIDELVVSSEGKTACKRWNSDDWGGYKRVLPPEILHHIGKDKTQCLERTNGIVRQQTGRWYRRQNKFGKVWEQTTVTTRIVVTYFNWIWQHSRLKTTATQRAGLTLQPWTWHDLITYRTII